MAQNKSFNELLEMLDKHELVSSEREKANALMQMARKNGSWGDPKLNISAMNFPVDSLKYNESMMTGVQLGLSQKLSLSGKYGKLKESGEESFKSKLASSKQLKRELARYLWLLGIEKEKLERINQILKENLNWLESNLKVSKRLYSTGKSPQQAVLDIQIRKSELTALIDQNKFEKESLKHKVSSLFESEQLIDINLSTIKWSYLDRWRESSNKYDFKKEELVHQLKSDEIKVMAQNRNLLPDITLGVSYTKRNDLDGLGDFVGASITIPIPSSSSRYAARKSSIYQKSATQKKLRNYIATKPSTLKSIELRINDLANQLKILKKQTLEFAKSSRDITAKSYARGGADYLELLRSELQYQSQLIKEANLLSNLKAQKLSYFFINGDALGLGSL